MRNLLATAVLLATAAPIGAQSRAEFGTRAQSEFKSADRDRDGRLTRGEVTRRIVMTQGRRGMSTSRSRVLTNQWFNRLDQDRDNMVTQREALAAAEELFSRADRNRDGRIGPRERQAGEALLREPSR